MIGPSEENILAYEKALSLYLKRSLGDTFDCQLEDVRKIAMEGRTSC